MEFKINDKSKYKTILDIEKQEHRIAMHSFHRYYGKLIPAIPSAFIKEFTAEGAIVFDPFSGSGTTAIEAIYHHRNFYGIEINPLSQQIATVKTTPLNIDVLNSINDKLFDIIKFRTFDINEHDLPFLQNRDHWFKDFVQKDLIHIKKSIDYLFTIDPALKTPDKIPYKKFYLMVISAILRNVSNADTMHVFPGISKRMRALEAEGKIHIDVISSFERAVKKRTTYYTFNDGKSKAEIFLGDATCYDLHFLKNKVDLIVTNPPYISSVRYIETLKLEMYWMNYIKSSAEYSALAHKMIGNDRLCKHEYTTIEYTAFAEINKIIDDMSAIDMKSAKILGSFFNMMEKVICNMYNVLKSGSKVVIKISDSKIKKKIIETGKLMTLIAIDHGFKLIDVFVDKIDENHRSLMTTRNTYSDVITQDYIIIWEKI